MNVFCCTYAMGGGLLSLSLIDSTGSRRVLQNTFSCCCQPLKRLCHLGPEPLSLFTLSLADVQGGPYVPSLHTPPCKPHPLWPDPKFNNFFFLFKQASGKTCTTNPISQKLSIYKGACEENWGLVWESVAYWNCDRGGVAGLFWDMSVKVWGFIQEGSSSSSDFSLVKTSFLLENNSYFFLDT